MNDGNIRLHPKYGLNPTIPVCIICEKETGEIALLGASYKGEAPKNMVVGIIPCDECKEKYLKNGVMLVEAEKKYGNKMPDITGKYVVIKNSAFVRLFNQQVPKEKIGLVEVGFLDKIIKKDE